MATLEQVKLSEKMPEALKRLHEAQEKLREYEAYVKKFIEDEAPAKVAEFQMHIAAANAEYGRSGQAKRAIEAEVPVALSRARDQAGSQFREHAETLKRAKDEVEGAAAIRARRQKEGCSKPELEGLVEQEARVAAALKVTQKRHAELEAEAAKTQAAWDAELARVKKSALKAAEPAKVGK